MCCYNDILRKIIRYIEIIGYIVKIEFQIYQKLSLEINKIT
jgi:hypothetical protein